MTSLLPVFFLVALQFSPNGDVAQAEAQPFRTAAECEKGRASVLAMPPIGLPPMVGLVCVEVGFPIRTSSL